MKPFYFTKLGSRKWKKIARESSPERFLARRIRVVPSDGCGHELKKATVNGKKKLFVKKGVC